MAVDVCGRCKALVRADQKYCHRCGRFAPALFGARRWFDRVFQSRIDHSRVLTVALAILYVVELAVTHRWPDVPGEHVVSMNPGSRASLLLGSLVDWANPVFGPRSQPWRVLTCTLLHANVVHILFNGVSLLIAGPYVEHLFGRARFWIVFVVTGIGGSVGWLLTRSQGSCVGASGAIFGIIGTMLAWGVREKTMQGRLVRDYALRWLLINLGLNLVMPFVAMSAHVGGAVTGFAIGWFFDLPTMRGGRESDLARFGGLGAIVLLVVSLVAAVVWDVAHLS